MTKMFLRLLCTCIPVLIPGSLVCGAKPPELSVTLTKAAQSDDIYIGQSLTVIMTVKFPAGTTPDVNIELIASTSDTIFALGEIYNHTVGVDLTSIAREAWFLQDVHFRGPEYKDQELPVYYNTRRVFNLGDVRNEGNYNIEEASYITITYQVVYASIGTYSPDQEYWISCGTQYNSDSYIWISQFSVNLKSMDPTFSGQADMTINSISEIEDEGIVDFTMKIGKAKTDVKMKAFVLNETTDLVPMKIQLISAGKGFDYSLVDHNFMAKQCEDCSIRNATLELKIGTIVNKESQRANAVEADNAIDMRVIYKVTNTSAVSNIYTLGIGVDLDGSEIYVDTFDVKVAGRHEAPTAFDNVAYNFSTLLPQGSRVFTGARFQLDMEVDIERNTTPGLMTIEIPIPADVPYIKLIEANTKSKGANVVCAPSGILETTTSSWNKSLNDSKRAVITVPQVCNKQSVDARKEDKWLISFDLQIDHPDLYMKQIDVHWGIGVNFSNSQVLTETIISNVIPPVNLGSIKIITGITVTESIMKNLPGYYVLQWSPDLMTFYDHQLKMFANIAFSPTMLVLRRPLVSQFLRLTTPSVAGSPAFNYTVNELDLENNLNFLGDTSAVATMMARFMFALDGDVNTCMDLPVKNVTDIPPYLIGQIATKLLNEDGFNDDKDLASDFKVYLIGQGLDCNSTLGPQRTLVQY